MTQVLLEIERVRLVLWITNTGHEARDPAVDLACACVQRSIRHTFALASKRKAFGHQNLPTSVCGLASSLVTPIVLGGLPLLHGRRVQSDFQRVLRKVDSELHQQLQSRGISSFSMVPRWKILFYLPQADLRKLLCQFCPNLQKKDE